MSANRGDVQHARRRCSRGAATSSIVHERRDARSRRRTSSTIQGLNEISSDTAFTLVEPGRNVVGHRLQGRSAAHARADACAALRRDSGSFDRFRSNDACAFVSSALLVLRSPPARARRRSAGAHGALPARARPVRPTRLTAIKLPSGQYNSFIGGGVVARCPGAAASCSGRQPRDVRRRGRVLLHRPRRLRRAAPHAHVGLPHVLPARGAPARRRSTSTRRCRAARTSRARSPSICRAIPKRPREQHGHARSAGRRSTSSRRTRREAAAAGDRRRRTPSAHGRQHRLRAGRGRRRPPRAHRHGDSLFIDGGTGLLRLMRKPQVVGTKGRRSRSSARRSICSRSDEARARARASARRKAVSEIVTLKSDTIDLRDQRRPAPSRHRLGRRAARAPSSPTQNMHRRFARCAHAGAAHARDARRARRGRARAARHRRKFQHDRSATGSRGDTIVAHFDTRAPGETRPSKPHIRQLVSHRPRHVALPPARRATPPSGVPAINYVRRPRDHGRTSTRPGADGGQVTDDGAAAASTSSPTTAAAQAASRGARPRRRPRRRRRPVPPAPRPSTRAPADGTDRRPTTPVGALLRAHDAPTPPRLQRSSISSRAATARPRSRCTRSSAPPTRAASATFDDVAAAAIATTTSRRCAPRAATPSARPASSSLDEVRQHLAQSVLPRLASERDHRAAAGRARAPDARIRIAERVWREIGGDARRSSRDALQADRRASRAVAIARARRPAAARAPPAACSRRTDSSRCTAGAGS